jgi:hypothetical protein
MRKTARAANACKQFQANEICAMMPLALLTST